MRYRLRARYVSPARFRLRPQPISVRHLGKCTLGAHNPSMDGAPRAHTDATGPPRRRGGRSRARGAPCAPPMCPDGHVDGAQLQASGHAGEKYVYCCSKLECSKWFRQRRPNLIRQGEDREAEWVDTPTARAAAEALRLAVADGKDAQLQSFGRPFQSSGRRCEGDLVFAFHNAEGLRGGGRVARDRVKLINYMAAITKHFDVCGICETNEDEAVRACWDALGYRVLSAPPRVNRGPGAGVALFIGKAVKGLTEHEVVWRSSGEKDDAVEQGKAMAVNLTIGMLRMCILVVHLPHTDTQQEKFMRQVRAEFEPEPGRAVMVMGDFNFVETPHLDVVPRGEEQHHQQAADELHATWGAWGGMVDVWRLVYGEAIATTHERHGRRAGPSSAAAATRRRLDRIYVSPSLAVGQPAISSARHVHSVELAVLDSKKELKESDHDAVSVTLRFSDLSKAKRVWRMDAREFKTWKGRAAITKLTEETLEQGAALASAEERHAALQRAHEAAGRKRDKEAVRAFDKAQRRLKDGIGMVLKWRLAAQPGTPKDAELLARAARMRKQLANLERKQSILERREKSRAAFTEDRGDAAHYAPLAKSLDQQPITHLEVPVPGPRRADGEPVVKHLREHDQIAAHLTEKYTGLFNLGIDLEPTAAKTEQFLASIRNDPEHRVTATMAASLQMEVVLSKANIKRAIMSLKRGTAPGADGLTADFYRAQHCTMVPHLHKLYMELYEKGEMTEAMKEAVVTLLFKGKGKRTDWKNYRPISITAIEYRILGRAVHLALKPLLPKLLGEPQIGFVAGRQIDENILCVAELARFSEARGRGGLFVMLDNAKAFDRVQPTFVQKVLEAFGFPAEFRKLIAMMYTNITSVLKVNGHRGEAFAVSNGVRQGCCLSPSIYVLAHEVFMRMIREDTRLRGIKIPGPRGEMAPGEQSELRERGFADDTGVALAGFEQLPHLFSICRDYMEISGSLLNEEKSVCLIMGSAKAETPPEDITMKWVRYGEEAMPSKYLGVKFAMSGGIGEQWESLRDKVEAEMGAAMGRFAPRSVFGRAMWVKGVFAAKLWYAYRFQLPAAGERERVLAEFQETAHRVMFGVKERRAWFVKRELARQEYEDGGLKLLDVEAHLKGEWVKMIRRLMEEPGVEKPWKNFWFHALDEVYSEAAGGNGAVRRLGLGPRLVTSTCTFERVRDAEPHLMSEVQRAALLAWGELRAQPVERLLAEVLKPGEEIPDAVAPSYQQATKAPLFFDLHSDEQGEVPQRPRESEERWRRRAAAAQKEKEKEAIEWAGAGLRTVADLLDDSGRDWISQLAFETKYPHLNEETYREVVSATSAGSRSAIVAGPKGWEVGDWTWARGGVAQVCETTAGRRARPRRVEPYVSNGEGHLQGTGRVVMVTQDECEEVAVWTRTGRGDAPDVHVLAGRSHASAPIDPKRVAVRWKSGLVERKPVRMEELGVKVVKQIMAARVWSMPRTFELEGEGCVAALIEAVKAMCSASTGGMTYKKAVAICFERARNTVLPRYLREIRYKVLTSGFMIGRNKQSTGDKRFCSRCKALGSVMACATRGARGRGTLQAAAHLEETMAHVFSDCPRAHGLWARVLGRWEKTTGERLDPKDKRVTLLGDRSGATSTSGSAPEEPWALLHATVLRVLWEERGRERVGGPSATTDSMHQKVQEQMASLADGRRVDVLRRAEEEVDASAQGGGKNSIEAFDALWVRTGLVRYTGGVADLDRGVRATGF